MNTLRSRCYFNCFPDMACFASNGEENDLNTPYHKVRLYSKLLKMKFAFKTALLLTLLSFTFFSCDQEEAISNSVLEVPELKSSEQTSEDYLSKILNSNPNGRIEAVLNLDESLTSTYEGYDNIEVVQVPRIDNSETYELYYFINGELEEDLNLQFINGEDAFSFVTELGIVQYYLNSNGDIIDIQITSNNVSAGRTECDPAGGFLDCANTINDGLRAELGNTGALIVEVGCGLWPPCRIGLTLTCVAVAADTCLNFNG